MYKKLAILTGLFAATVCPSLLAQQMEPMRVSIPFDFRIGAENVPAGNYEIQASNGILMFRHEGRFVALTLTIPASRFNAPTTGLVQFHRYGNDYFLASIWTPYNNSGVAVPESKQEKEVARLAGGALVQTAAVHAK